MSPSLITGSLSLTK